MDGLKGLTGLQTLDLYGCSALENVDGLKALTALQTLSLSGCRVLQNVDALKGLTGLFFLNLEFSTSIPASALDELRAALPKTYITSPDGKISAPK